MNYDVIIQFINGVGFPIAVSVALFYTNMKQDERYSNLTKDLQATINNNTKVLTELCAKIEGNISNGKN